MKVLESGKQSFTKQAKEFTIQYFTSFYKTFNERFSKNSTLRKMYPYSVLFWSVFSRSWTKYGEILCITLYSVRIRENTDQNNSEYGHILRSANLNESGIE